MVARLHFSFISFRPQTTACCLVFALLTSAWLLSPCVESQQRPGSSPTLPASAGKAITVWKVGSPFRGDVPDTAISPDLASSAEELGYKLRIQSFPARGFAETFLDAFANNQEPDILVIDNYGMIDGISTPLGDFTGIGSNQQIRQNLVKVSESLRGLEGPKRGWEFLIRTSKNYDTAKSLALRTPKCNERWGNLPLTGDLRAIAVQAGPAYVEGALSLEAFQDPKRLYIKSSNQEQRKAFETRECGYWGNDQLAFVPMVISYESAQELGHATVLLALRRQESEWRLLVASRDPVTTANFLSQLPKLSSLLEKPLTPDSTPLPAVLDSPDEGQFPKPPSGQRFGDFNWQPSSSVDVVAEIVEFAYTNDARLVVEFPSGDSRMSEQVSAGELWTTHGPWKWRVWSITEAGAVSFSEARSFLN